MKYPVCNIQSQNGTAASKIYIITILYHFSDCCCIFIVHTASPALPESDAEMIYPLCL